MPDMEKVIKGVHDARRYLEDREWVDKSVGVHIDALNDVLALLKEQEPVKRKISPEGVRCGECARRLRYDSKFCDKCGQAVKWK